MSIALILSVLLGFTVYTIGGRYEDQSRDNAVKISARQLMSQMEDRLDRMDSIMNYILSDPAILRGITILGMGDRYLQGSVLASAESELQVGLTTDYIIHNTHRTVFYNQSGTLVSSYVSDILNQRLDPSFSTGDLTYLENASGARGKAVLVGGHKDPFGAYDDEMVYSLVKALQGHNMGFLEAENTVKSLEELDLPEDGTEYLIYVNDGELLFKSSSDIDTDSLDGALRSLRDGESMAVPEFLIACSRSDAYDLAIYTLKPESVNDGKSALIMTAFLSTLVVFLIGMVFVLIWSYVMSKPVIKLREIVENTNLDNLKTEDRRSVFSNEPEEFRVLSESYQAMTERLDKAVRKERRSSLLFLQAQFDTLQTQVNPHFIYNVLNIISARGIIVDDEVISEMCGSLAEMLRYSTSNKERYATVGQELNYLNNYFYLIKRRYEDRFEYSVNIDEAMHDVLIPKMVLQQLVENSLSHGFENTDIVMKIEIEGSRTGNGWSITIGDNGEGFKKEKLDEIRQKLKDTQDKVQNLKETVELEIGGMGLINTYARCLLLFGDRIIFEVGNGENGAVVTVGEKNV